MNWRLRFSELNIAVSPLLIWIVTSISMSYQGLLMWCWILPAKITCCHPHSCEPLLFTGGYPYTISRLVARGGLAILARMARRKAQQRGILVSDNFYGMLAGGNMREEFLLNIVANLPQGVSEIMVHPGGDDGLLSAAYGWGYHWQAELADL